MRFIRKKEFPYRVDFNRKPFGVISKFPFHYIRRYIFSYTESNNCKLSIWKSERLVFHMMKPTESLSSSSLSYKQMTTSFVWQRNLVTQDFYRVCSMKSEVGYKENFTITKLGEFLHDHFLLILLKCRSQTHYLTQATTFIYV